MRAISILGILVAVTTQSACVMVGGYRSGGGWFIWPGSLGFIVLLILLYFIFGRRR